MTRHVTRYGQADTSFSFADRQQSSDPGWLARSGSAPPYGFDTTGTEPWLPQPANWSLSTVEAQTGVPEPMLELYRLRRTEPALGDGTLTWLDVPAGALAFARDESFACVVNTSGAPGDLPPGTAVWLRTHHGATPSSL